MGLGDVRIGRLRHQIVIQTPTVTTNDRGAEVLAWPDSPAIAAEIRTVGGSERGTTDVILPLEYHQITIRWPLPTGVSLTTKSRIKWVSVLNSVTTTRYFGITFIGEPDNRLRMVQLNCTEIDLDSGVI